jgi:Na+/H+ antiporter NhaD/arsenite permease-like protein
MAQMKDLIKKPAVAAFSLFIMAAVVISTFLLHVFAFSPILVALLATVLLTPVAMYKDFLELIRD